MTAARLRLAAARRRARRLHDAAGGVSACAVGLLQRRDPRRRRARGRGARIAAGCASCSHCPPSRCGSTRCMASPWRTRIRCPPRRHPTADASVATDRGTRLRGHGRRLPAGAVREPRWDTRRRRARGLARACGRRARANGARARRAGRGASGLAGPGDLPPAFRGR